MHEDEVPQQGKFLRIVFGIAKFVWFVELLIFLLRLGENHILPKAFIAVWTLIAYTILLPTLAGLLEYYWRLRKARSRGPS